MQKSTPVLLSHTRYKSMKKVDGYIHNSVVALAGLIPQLTEKMIADDLGFWRKENITDSACGTEACFGGWCAADQYFQKKGLFLEHYFTRKSTGEVEYWLHAKDKNKKLYNGMDAAQYLFGNSTLFASSGYYEIGDCCNYFGNHQDEYNVSKLQLIKNRMKTHLDFLTSIVE